jgi:hypothetical protein
MVDRGVFSDIFNPLSFVDEAVRSFAATQGPVDLGPDFAPGVGSVICGRGECQAVLLRSISMGAENRGERAAFETPAEYRHAVVPLSPTCSISAYCWATCTIPAHFSCD